MSATEANQRWNRTEGVLIAPGTTSEEVAAVLDQERVLARLEWYPATEHLLSLTLLTDAEGRVAVTPARAWWRRRRPGGLRADGTPGPPLPRRRRHRPRLLPRPAA